MDIKNDSSVPFTSSSSPPSVGGVCTDKGKRLRFGEAFDKSKTQVDYYKSFGEWTELFERGERSNTVGYQNEIAKIALSMCKVMAEVFMMPDTVPIRISGEYLDAPMVKSIFEELTAEHLRATAEEYLRDKKCIRNPKSYLRTVLYNSVLAFDAGRINKQKSEKPRYGSFDVDEAFSIALARSYGETEV